MHLPRISDLLYPGFLFRRRKKSKRVTALRNEDAKLQAERQARITARSSHSHPRLRAAAKATPQKNATLFPSLAPVPVPVPIPQEIPVPTPDEPLRILSRPSRSRGTYANDFSGRRITANLSRAES